MARQIETMETRILYGHTNTEVVMEFQGRGLVNRMTPDQTRAMITTLQATLERLEAHMAQRSASALQ